jgi:hypothetical protein
MRWWWDPLCTRLTRWVNWIFIVLVHWNNSPRVDMSLHLDTLFCFRASQFLLFLLNAACLATNTNCIVWFDPTGAWTHDLPPNSRRARFEPMIYHTWSEHVTHYAVSRDIGEIRINADDFHNPHHLAFSYAVCGHVYAYNQVYSREGYQIDYFPPFLSHLIWLVDINIKRNTYE